MIAGVKRLAVLLSALLLAAPVAALAQTPPPAAWQAISWSREGYHPRAPHIIALPGVPAGTRVQIERTAKLADTTAGGNDNDKGPRAVRSNEPLMDAIRRKLTTNTRGYDESRPVAGRHRYKLETRLDDSHEGLLDFAAVEAPARYEITVYGTKTTPAFSFGPLRISDYVYWDPVRPLLRSLYLSRVGRAIRDTEDSTFSRDAGHQLLLPPENHASPRVFALGGWYDGNGYHQSTLAHALILNRLMAFWLDTPAQPVTYLSLAYPENEPGRLPRQPDLVHELRYGLDWLEAMAAPEVGIYAGVTAAEPPKNAVWPKPMYDPQPRRLQAPTPEATLAAIGTLARAARLMPHREQDAAVRYLRAALSQWQRLPEQTDKTLAPLRLFAVLELYLATGTPAFYNELATLTTPGFAEVFGGSMPASQLRDEAAADLIRTMANRALPPHGNDTGLEGGTLAPELPAELRQALAPLSDWLKTQLAAKTATSLEPPQAITAQALYSRAMAQSLLPDAQRAARLARAVEIPYGRNATATVWITGLETRANAASGHALSIALGKTMPGLWVPPGAAAVSLADSVTLAYVLAVLNTTYNPLSNAL